MAIKDTLLALGFTAFGGFLMSHGIHKIRNQQTLEKHGVSVVGKLSNVEIHKGTFSGTSYNFWIDYQGRRGYFSIDKEGFRRYTHGDTFTPGTPIEILYLEKEPGTAEIKEMMGKWFYGWGDGPGYTIVISLFPLIIGLLWLWYALFGNKREDDD